MGRFKRSASLLAAVIIAAGFALSACSTESGVVDNGRLADLQADGARIVDVRTAGEYGAGYIAGAENVPLMGLSAAAASWDPAEPIVVYCATGERSAEAAQILRSLGFARVYDLSAGIIAWNGELAGGAPPISESPADADAQTSSLPVAYEFYTDW
ncbi:MAG: rhodanese-like domain-containing protein [Coriobacteriia bacterium]|nr:rhodanese-like domain-containing protein [Coriobacteriia bacterium]